MKAGRIEIPGKNLTDSLAEKMGDAIMQGALGPGELLPPLRQLADHHKVGIVTVKNAIDKLINLNIVESVPRVGYRVHESSSKVPGLIKIGVIYRKFRPRNTSMQSTISAIEAEIRKRDWLLMFAISEGDTYIEDACIKRLRNAGMQALIIVPAIVGKKSYELEKWIKEGHPTVLEGHPGHWLFPADIINRCDRIDVDNALGVKRSLDYLWSLGHKKISFMTTGKVKFNKRLKGYRAFIKKNNIPDRSVLGIPKNNDEAAEHIKKWIKQNKMVTAIVCQTDDLAFNVVEVATSLGINIPSELSVIGFGNDIVEFPHGMIPLTTVDYSRKELGSECLRMLDSRLGGNTEIPEKVYLDTPLIIRESCSICPNGKLVK